MSDAFRTRRILRKDTLKMRTERDFEKMQQHLRDAKVELEDARSQLSDANREYEEMREYLSKVEKVSIVLSPSSFPAELRSVET